MSTKTSNIKSKGTVSFYFTGESFTYLIRDFWNSNLVKSVIEITNDCKIPIETAIDICIGKLKCVGDTRKGDHTLAIEKDDTTDGIYFTLESQVEHFEKKFVEISQRLTRTMRKYRLLAGQEGENGFLDVPGEMSVTGAHYRKFDSKYDRRVIEDLKSERRKVLENLSILYPIVGKTLADLPIEEIGTAYSDIEIDHYSQYEYRTRDIEEGELDGKEVDEIKKIIEPKKKPFDPTSYDIQDDETEEEYFERRGKMAEATNLVVDVKKTDTRNAWISPDGKMYTVEYQPFPMHINAASDFVYMGMVPEKIWNESEWLEKNGWMKMTSGSFMMQGKLSQAQIDMLFDYMTARKLKKLDWYGREKTLEEIIENNEITSKYD